MNNTKRLLIILSVLVGITACRTVYIPSQDSKVHYHYVDSIRWVDSLVPVPVPVERYVDVVPEYDTLKLESTLARSVSYVDTLTHTLKGKLENKQDSVKTVIKVKERRITEYKDSVVTKTVPYPVVEVREVVPKWCWWLLGINVLMVVGILVKLYLRLKTNLI